MLLTSLTNLLAMDIDEAFNRVKKASRNVSNVVALDKDNHIIRSLNGEAAREQMTNLIKVVDKGRAAFKENDELTFLKLRTKRHEYLVVPDKEFMLVAILNPSDESAA